MSTETVDSYQEMFEQLFKKQQYREQIAKLQAEGKQSVTLDFADLANLNMNLAEQVLDNPKEYLEKHASNAALEQLKIEDLEYSESIKKLNVRLSNLFTTTPLRKILAPLIGKMIMIQGVVVRTSIVKPKVTRAAFECKKCGYRTFVIQEGPGRTIMRKPYLCKNPECECIGPFEFVEDESDKVDLQEIGIQESSDELPPGQMPRSLHLKLYEDNVDIAHPGDNVQVVGMVATTRRSTKAGLLLTSELFVEVNSIKILGEEAAATPTKDDTNKILELGKDPFVHKKIICSIAPSIYGYDDIKEAIMYILFGGVPKELPDMKIRGESNILLIGDPGTAKSQLLRYVARIAPRGLYTSGKGTTSAGLTAAVTKDADTGSFQLEAGALVLADKGIACIDEMDKMNPSDTQSIHEALEQHSVSIAKAGIVATLNARTAVLAAANPVLGRYNSYTTIIENISFPVTLLSRFDLIFLMRDVPNQKRDRALAKHILNLHSGTVMMPPIDPLLLRKYIAYAKQINPEMSDEAKQKLEDFYLQMRKNSEKEGSPIAITARQLEAIVRLSEAHARAGLKSKVSEEDAEAAIRITMNSLQEVGLDSGGKPDVDILLTGKPKSARDKLGTILKLIIEGSKDVGMCELEPLFDQLEKEYGIPEKDSRKLLEQLGREGAIYNPREGWVKKA